jgi:CheY-like chemotaxis protein
VIGVADTGAGMSPEVLAHAMEPFYTARADGTGTGLGLAMVYGFMRQSGGDIQITSTPGQGTAVRLTLPLEAKPSMPLPKLGTVLLVEDDPVDRAVTKAVLAPAAAELCLAEDAETALKTLNRPVDLLVTDLSLQGRIEGWRLAEAALTRWPAARAVVVSGHLPEVNPLLARFPDRVIALAKPLTSHALAQVTEWFGEFSTANSPGQPTERPTITPAISPLGL